jgi:sulfite reductase alpha subunit-like flavoprotein
MSSFVVYASERGTSKGVATQIGTATGIPVVDVKEFDFDSLPTYAVVIFVVSNYGKGDAPGSSKAIWEKFFGSSPDLSAVKVAVFTSGSAKFGPTFAAFGKKVQAKLAELKATQLGELGIKDATGANSTDIDAWIASLGLPPA